MNISRPRRSPARSRTFTLRGYVPAVPQTFRSPDHAVACAAARGLQRHGLTARAGVRRHLAHRTVRFERTDVDTLVRALEPRAVPVLEHLPRPLADDDLLAS